MQADSWISLASAAVAVAAASVAGWQGVQARRSAEAAEDQATAAKDQVEIMRRQEEAYQAERDERDAPMFTYTPKGRTGSICKIEIRMDSGPQEVTIRILEIRVRPERHDPADTGLQLPDDNHQYRVVPGGDFLVDVDLRAGRDSVKVEFWLECTELSELGRSWTHRESVPVAAPPALPRLA